MLKPVTDGELLSSWNFSIVPYKERKKQIVRKRYLFPSSGRKGGKALSYERQLEQC